MAPFTVGPWAGIDKTFASKGARFGLLSPGENSPSSIEPDICSKGATLFNSTLPWVWEPMPSFQHCPVCGVPVKWANLPSHMKRVHPRARVGGPKESNGPRPIRPRPAALGRSNRKLLYAILGVGLLVASLAVYGLAFTQRPGDGAEPPVQAKSIEVYLQPTCGCCHQYLDYLEQNGFDVTTHEMTDLSGVKANYGIPRNMWSCHTSAWGTYFVEGHVPMAALLRLMEGRPAIDGISLPGMPAGSPGMGGVKGAPFVIYALEGGLATVFMEV